MPLASVDSLPPGEAVFDYDGTLVQGDIGESTVRVFQERGMLTPEIEIAFGPGWARYHTLSPVAQAILCAEALEGRTVAEVEGAVDEAFERGMVEPRPEVCELAARMSLRHRVWVLSGSPEVVVRAAAPRVGLRHVIGLRSYWNGDRLSGRVERPIPTDEGKVQVCWWRIGRRPVFSIGDSPWDLPLLRLAHVARTTGRIAGQEFPAFP